jgi:mannose-6-phosphate isomerase
MPSLYPLRFRPLFRRYLWGGRGLAEVLGKELGEGNDYAESWEIVDRGADQSLLLAGELAGQTLRQIAAEHGEELYGRHHPQPRFPLLFKFLDCRQMLSVQVHPNDEQASRLDPPDLGKTEAWVILRAEPGAEIYAGLKRGFDRAALEREVHRGTTSLCLNRVEPRAGDCLFLPAGVVHALGAGLLVAEIQQASDTTYRLFDWNRIGADGQPRPLHIEQALAAIDYGRGPLAPQVPQATETAGVTKLVASEKFNLDRCDLITPQSVGGGGRFHILAVIDGEATLAGDPLNTPLRLGDVALLPASAGPTLATPVESCTLLDAYLP